MKLDRRDLIRRAGLASAGLLIGRGAALRGLDLLDPRGIPLARARVLGQDVELPGMPSFITPTERFYTVSKNSFGDPNVNGDRWRLKIGGLVSNPLELSLSDIRGFES